jgi:hypothetical protein
VGRGFKSLLRHQIFIADQWLDQFDHGTPLGLLFAYIVTNAGKMTVESEEPYLLIHEKKLSSRQPMLPVLRTAPQEPVSVRSLLTTTEVMIAGKKSAAAAPVRLGPGMDF